MLPQHLRPLFWDISLETFEPRRYPAYTIRRVLEHGDEDDVEWLFREFSTEDIRRVLRTDRRLSARSANFWALILHVPVADVAALQG